MTERQTYASGQAVLADMPAPELTEFHREPDRIPAAAGALVGSPNRFFFLLTGLAMLLSAVVEIEPAPVDGMILGLLLVGVLSGILAFNAIRPLPLVCLSALVVANVISLYDPFDGVRATWYILVTVYLCLSWIFFVTFLWRYQERGVRLIIGTYSFAAVVSVLLGLLSYFHFIGAQKYLLLYGRPKGLFKDPNVYGPYLIPVALFAFAGLIRQTRGIRRVLIHMAVVLITTAGTLLSFSRACWINYAVSLIAYVVFGFLLRPAGSRSPISFSRVLGIVLGGGLCVGMLLQLPAVQTMMAKRITSNGLHDYDRDRFRTQHMAFESAEQRPFGIGPGQSEQVFHYATHSSYMRILGENGYLGFAAYLSFVIVCLGRALFMAARARDSFWRKIFLIAAACILGHIVNSGVVDTVHWRHYWFLLALPWSAPVLAPIRSVASGTYRIHTRLRSGRPLHHAPALGPAEFVDVR